MSERGETRVAVDLVVFGLVEGELSVLMGRRPHAPYEGFWALPGEFRHSGQPVDELAREVLERTTGVERAWVEQLATFDRPPVIGEGGGVSTPGRDPRGEIVSVAYMAAVAEQARVFVAWVRARGRGVHAARVAARLRGDSWGRVEPRELPAQGARSRGGGGHGEDEAGAWEAGASLQVQ